MDLLKIEECPLSTFTPAFQPIQITTTAPISLISMVSVTMDKRLSSVPQTSCYETSCGYLIGISNSASPKWKPISLPPQNLSSSNPTIHPSIQTRNLGVSLNSPLSLLPPHLHFPPPNLVNHHVLLILPQKYIPKRVYFS